ncbi:MAG: hypothetical protein FJX53_07955 [Alphaproteobacteria bacterium]|nr:hypothetical protein [Alphaproteobacteria bacterium]
MSSRESEQSRTDGERDASGRFVAGNRTSLRGGNPSLRRLGELQTAVREAATADDVRAVLAALKERALAGCCASASVWLSRTCGAPRTFVEVDLPAIGTAADFGAAMRAILADVAAGRLDVAAAEKVATLARATADAVCYEQLAERVAAVEALR